MLIKFTEQCFENCTHCFESANADGKEMSDEVFCNLLKFLERVKPPQIQITGGEFTLHSNFYNMIKQIIDVLNDNTIIILESNGSFIEDQTKTFAIQDLLKNNAISLLQIRTHKVYYPNYEKTINNKEYLESLSSKIHVFSDGITYIYPLGRGKNFSDSFDFDNKLPFCIKPIVNIKQYKMIKSDNDFKSFLIMQILTGATCTPSIDIHGNIKLGESRFCKTVASITDTNDSILKSIDKFEPCGKCGVSITDDKLNKKLKRI